MLTPEIKTVAIQLPIIKIDCPRSGCSTSNMITEIRSKKSSKTSENLIFDLQKHEQALAREQCAQK